MPKSPAATARWPKRINQSAGTKADSNANPVTIAGTQALGSI